MKFIFSSLAVGILMTGCATTGGDNTPKNEPLFFAGFSPQTDGGFVHGGTGLVCPETLLGLPSSRQNEYGNTHTDASCGYSADSTTVATVFLSELNYTFEEIFQSSVASVFQGPLAEGLSVDQDASQSCILGGILAVAADQATALGSETQSGESNEQLESYGFQAAVLSKSDAVSFVQLTEIDGKFLKLRYTLLGVPKEKGLDHCIEGATALKEVYDLTRARNLALSIGKS